MDAKGRVSVPAPFRKVLLAEDPDCGPDAPPSLILVTGRKGRGCLEGFSIEGAARLDAIVDSLPPFSNEQDALARKLIAQSRELQLDPAGRIMLSRELRDLIGADAEVTFVGMSNRFQIWEPAAYARDNETLPEWVAAAEAEDDIFTLLRRAQERAAQ
ncbi:MAG: cell division/cell wall cluster transcriptional repressor MraZ [Pseudomonadota bacterium]